ncbi:DUF2247 family protein [Oceanobacillus senegalensis]|uniref:DUF2247 family protein n=1 Tax=Oceanobacillus senegalensis TaxID=1936063 RepID=UPI000A30BAA7|nr:DUF2247 family protein [Oceanobacillus senegalensis]
MNDLKIFERYKVDYNWATLLVGLELERLNVKEVAKYAEMLICSNPQITNENMIELAWTKTDRKEVVGLLQQLLKNINVEYDFQNEKRKWRYCLLMKLKEVEEDKKILLEKVAQIYSDFHYPEDMEGFIYYLEPKEELSQEKKAQTEYLENLIENLHKFLENEQIFINHLK